jgi:hypothetical protein
MLAPENQFFILRFELSGIKTRSVSLYNSRFRLSNVVSFKNLTTAARSLRLWLFVHRCINCKRAFTLSSRQVKKNYSTRNLGTLYQTWPCVYTAQPIYLRQMKIPHRPWWWVHKILTFYIRFVFTGRQRERERERLSRFKGKARGLKIHLVGTYIMRLILRWLLAESRPIIMDILSAGHTICSTITLSYLLFITRIIITRYRNHC